MKFFSFTAPTLLELDAIPSANEIFHDASRERSERLVKIKKFAFWLKAEMQKAGLPTKKDLLLDPDGWVFEVATKEGSVMCIVSNVDGDGTQITLLVTEMGGPAEGIDEAVKALLKRSSEIADLKVLQE
jgi:hypothetical protein